MNPYKENINIVAVVPTKHIIKKIFKSNLSPRVPLINSPIAYETKNNKSKVPMKYGVNPLESWKSTLT
jgi:hypothetical protein